MQLENKIYHPRKIYVLDTVAPGYQCYLNNGRLIRESSTYEKIILTDWFNDPIWKEVLRKKMNEDEYTKKVIERLLEKAGKELTIN